MCILRVLLYIMCILTQNLFFSFVVLIVYLCACVRVYWCVSLSHQLFVCIPISKCHTLSIISCTRHTNWHRVDLNLIHTHTGILLIPLHFLRLCVWQVDLRLLFLSVACFLFLSLHISHQLSHSLKCSTRHVCTENAKNWDLLKCYPNDLGRNGNINEIG